MKAKSFIPSLTVKIVHLVVVLAISLTSAFSAAGVKRASAKGLETQDSGLTMSGFFNLVVPAYHRQQALRDKVFAYLGIQPGNTSGQTAEQITGDEEGITPTPTISDNLPPTDIPTATSTEALSPTEIITPTETLVPTLTPTPTETATLAPSETPTLPETTVTPIPSETVTPTEATVTPSPSATSTSPATPLPTVAVNTPTPKVTATETVTATPSLPPGIAGQAQVRLGGTSEWIAAGHPFTLTWGIDGLSSLPLGMSLVLTLPDGFTPLGAPAGSWVAGTQKLTLSLATLGGWSGMNVSPEAVGPFTFHAELYWRDTLLATQDVTLQQEWLTRLGVEGGLARGLRDRVQVAFPSGVLPEAAEVHIHPLRQGVVPYSLSGQPIDITVVGQDSGVELHQFSQPITVTIHYSDTQVRGDESALTLFHYDETVGDWESLPSQVDTANNLLVGVSERFSPFDFNAQDWEAARLPTLKNFQVSSFTGAATYSFPIQVPPGPAGLQPSLSVSYNSQTVDSASSRTQASWVGMGWSLDTGYIQRNQNGTRDYYGSHFESVYGMDEDYNASSPPRTPTYFNGSDGDDTFSLVVNGQSWTLLRLPDTDTDPNTIDYRTTDESFWRIRRYHSHGNYDGYYGDTSYWVVWDKTGTQYYFGQAMVGGNPVPVLARYPVYPGGCGSAFLVTWQWPLTRVRTIFGQEMKYSYSKDQETKKHTNGYCRSQGDGYPSLMDVAIYPDLITYSNDRYRIQFIKNWRVDYDSDWDYFDRYTLYMRFRLSEIKVWHDPGGVWNSGDEQLIRKYAFGFGERSQQIFPNVIWRGGGKTLTLTSITEYGFNGTSSLPATAFNYGDAMHLSEANNGYGGIVTFNYETFPWYELSSDSDPIINTYQEVFIDPGFYYADDPVEVFYPSQEVLVSLCTTPVSLSNVSLGVYDGTQNNPAQGLTYQDLANADCYGRFFTGYVRLPPNATQERFFFQVLNERFIPYSFKARLLTTRTRVISKTQKDPTYSPNESSTTRYRYDDAATNDAAHSQLVASTTKDTRYNPAYGEYRGNSLVKEIDPGGKVSSTFYYQDDNRNGKPSASLVSTESFNQPFTSTQWSDYSATWTYYNSQPVFERVTGDVAANVTNAGANWNVAFYRSAFTISGGKAAILQFRLNSTSQKTILALASADGGYYRWGLKQDGSAFYVQKCTSLSGCDDSPNGQLLLNYVQAGRWYVLALVVDSANDDHFLIWVWDRDDPSTTQAGRYEEDLSIYGGKNWGFIMKVNSGTAWLDEYSEGKLYALNSTYYATQSYTTPDAQLPTKENGTVYRDVQCTWTYEIEQRSASFEGDATWTGTRTEYFYLASDQGGLYAATQFGNRTRVYESEWNGSAFVRYRFAYTKYYPNWTSTVWLVGLPAYTLGYKCPGGSCDWEATDWMSFSESLYDGHTSYADLPEGGKLTGSRTLLYCVNNNCGDANNWRFSDTAYAYDAYGNRTTITAYTGEGTNGAFGQGTVRSSYTCYGGGGTLGGNVCTDDNYHTYALWERNVLGHFTRIIYDDVAEPISGAKGYTLSVPVKLIDPNYVVNEANATTTAQYDGFGRMTAIIRYGDDSSNPTARMSYYDTASPFYTQAEQRISGSTYFKIRKFYNGVGQLLQTQVIGAVVNGVTKDIRLDTWYTHSGQVWKQSVPYQDDTGKGYQNRIEGNAYNAYNTYDPLGRPENVYATDGSSTSYVYKDLETEVTDARGKTTHTTTDVWGRTVWVVPPAGVSVRYTSYDTQGRLLQVLYGTATTNLTYDLAGRKLTMDDPDLGDWSYGYDAMGNLSRQTDAKGQTICMYYDQINRMKGKNYRSDVNCPADPGGSNYSVYYAYDDTASGNYGIGRRTYMRNDTGYTGFRFDARGRLTDRFDTVNGAGGGNFRTQWIYNSVDLVSRMYYPANNQFWLGENVDSFYNPQMLLDWSYSSSYYYAKKVYYDAAGRVDLLSLGKNGSNPLVNIDYVYNLWTSQGGRLQQLKGGTVANPTSLQNLTYNYDNNGNILSILDANNSNQKQCFGYDDLNRLTSAKVGQNDANCTGSVGNGEYADEIYNYDDPNTGNLSSKAGVAYTYQDSAHKHAVTHLGGVQKYWYDANGNMITRIVGSTYNYTYDYENHLTSVSGGTTASFAYDADGVRVKSVIGNVTTVYIGNYYEYTTQTSGLSPILVTPLNYGVACQDNATGTGYLMYSAENVATRFAANPPNPNNASHFICVKYVSGAWKYDNDTAYYTFIPEASDILMAAVNFDTDTVTSLQGTNTVENGIAKGYASGNLTYTADWWNGASNDGEFTVGGSSFTPNALLGGTKYYYAGSTRVAMRTGSNAPLWLLGDHLGSTSQVANYDGTPYTNGLQLYKPWGEKRYPTGASGLPTTYRYTGQKQDSYINLYWYGSRWYDDSLGRFIQPDTIVPEPKQGVQVWDRFGYVNNNPTTYNDPTGHCPWCVIIGAAVGAAVSYGTQVYNNYKNNGGDLGKALTTNISGEKILGGAVAGATVGLGVGIVSTLVGGGSLVAGGSTIVGDLATSRLQSITNSANEQLAADPTLAQGYLTQAEYAAGQNSTSVANMEYGNAIERMVDDKISNSFIDNLLFQHVGGPNNPDFVGNGILSGMTFEMTTPAQVINHLDRAYGPSSDFLLYNRPPDFTTFP